MLHGGGCGSVKVFSPQGQFLLTSLNAQTPASKSAAAKPSSAAKTPTPAKKTEIVKPSSGMQFLFRERKRERFKETRQNMQCLCREHARDREGVRARNKARRGETAKESKRVCWTDNRTGRQNDTQTHRKTQAGSQTDTKTHRNAGDRQTDGHTSRTRGSGRDGKMHMHVCLCECVRVCVHRCESLQNTPPMRMNLHTIIASYSSSPCGTLFSTVQRINPPMRICV